MGIPSGSPGHWCRGLGAYPSAWLCHRPVAAAVGHRLPELAAEVISSLVKTLARWYSTVRGDRNSWVAISGFDRPARASRAIWASCGVSWSRVAGGARADGLAGGQQLAAGPFGERLHADRGEHVVRGAQLRPGFGPSALAAQPLAVEQVRAGEFGPEAGAAQPVDRLAIPAVGVLAVAE